MFMKLTLHIRYKCNLISKAMHSQKQMVIELSHSPYFAKKQYFYFTQISSNELKQSRNYFLHTQPLNFIHIAIFHFHMLQLANT